MKIFWILTLTLCSARHQNEDKTETRIFGGKHAKPHSVPGYVVFGVHSTAGVVKTCCAGTLIREKTILTAAACILCITEGRPFIDVIFGTYDLGIKEPGVITYRVGKANFIFPDTSDWFQRPDIAIVHLPTAVKLSHQIGLAPLFPGEVRAGTLGDIVGYGDIQTRPVKAQQIGESRVISMDEYLDMMSKTLEDKNYLHGKGTFIKSMDPKLAMLDDEAFKNAMLKLYKKNFSSKKVFVGHNGETSIEKGELGSPFFVKGTGQIGGVALMLSADDHKFGKAGATVYARIDANWAWINANMI